MIIDILICFIGQTFPDRKSDLLFKDLSKLGTQFSDGRIANGQERSLKDGDRLIFGTAGISRFK